MVGDRSTNSNLRYKHGRNLTFEAKDVLAVKDPADAFLPKANVSTTYIFAKKDQCFDGRTTNHFVNFYRHVPAWRHLDGGCWCRWRC